MPEETKDVGGYHYTRPRGPVAAMYSSPGPIYALPPLVGHSDHDKRSTQPIAPAYSFGLKTKDMGPDRSPGPAAYEQNPRMNHRGYDGAPQYSLGARKYYDKKFEIPGPGTYRPEDTMNATLRRQPAYTFGLKSDLRGNKDTPGPGQYVLPESHKTSLSKTAPSFTMTGRGRIPNTFGESPGPAAYSVPVPDVYLPGCPKYTMSSKAIPPPYRGSIPGPGTYRPEDQMYAFKNRPPQFTFGMKHSPYKGEYIVEPKDNDD